MKKTVAIDFDGTLAQYQGWVDASHTLPPVPGAREFVAALMDEGYRVVVHTTRNPDVVWEWLECHGFPGLPRTPEEWAAPARPLDVSRYKVPAMVYIDDRAHRFDGDWRKAREAIEQKCWWQDGDPLAE